MDHPENPYEKSTEKSNFWIHGYNSCIANGGWVYEFSPGMDERTSWSKGYLYAANERKLINLLKGK